MASEYQALPPHPLPEGRATVGSKWVYQIKYNADGKISRHKARLIAHGFMQVQGLDYEETFAPVTGLETICLLFAIAVSKDWKIHQVDVKTTYLYGDLDEEIYMDPPFGYPVPEGHTLHLKKALYGLKQAGSQWYQKLKFMGKFGLHQITNDPNTFVAHKVVKGVRHTLILPAYVDNLFPIGDKVLMDEFEAWIPKYFNVTLTGNASLFLRIRVMRSRTSQHPWLLLNQMKYVEMILSCFSISKPWKASTPFPQNKNLLPNTKEADKKIVCTYQSVIELLIYLMLGTQPDFAYTVSKAA